MQLDLPGAAIQGSAYNWRRPRSAALVSCGCRWQSRFSCK